MNSTEQTKSSSRGVSRDMSPQAISRRFDILVELDRTARALRSARPVEGSAGEPAPAEPPDPTRTPQ